MNGEICLVLRLRSAELNTELETSGFYGPHIFVLPLYWFLPLGYFFLNSLLMFIAFFYLFVSVKHFDLPLQMNGVIPIKVPHLFNRPSSSTVINTCVLGGGGGAVE